MAQTGNTTWSLPVKTAINDDSDRVMILWGASTANTPSSVAQTATIPVSQLYNNANASISANNISVNGQLSILNGNIVITNLPVADPHVPNQLWSNSGVLTISSG